MRYQYQYQTTQLSYKGSSAGWGIDIYSPDKQIMYRHGSTQTDSRMYMYMYMHAYTTYRYAQQWTCCLPETSADVAADRGHHPLPRPPAHGHAARHTAGRETTHQLLRGGLFGRLLCPQCHAHLHPQYDGHGLRPRTDQPGIGQVHMF